MGRFRLLATALLAAHSALASLCALAAAIAVLVAATFAFVAQPAQAAAPSVTVLTIDGPIGPATADYFTRGMARAAASGSQLVILEMDTPGGLDTSMRQIIKTILASPIPVASFVAPGGARAASAGTYILYASHVAAMAPGTNLGAATPVQIGLGGPAGEPDEAPDAADRNRDAAKEGTNERGKDADAGSAKGGGKPGATGTGKGEARGGGKADAKAGGKGEASGPGTGAAKSDEKPPREGPFRIPKSRDTMTAKQINDAAAYIRGLANLHGRNAEWAERAVRESVSLSADEALKMKVIDLIADDRASLLKELDGRSLTVLGTTKKLATTGADQVAYEPDWRTRLLGILTNPSVALILMMIGIYGLLFEFSSPGMVAPGVIGGICLLLAMFAFQWLPVNYAGVGLILLGIAFMVAEAFLPSFGVIGIGGIVSFAIGAVMLIDTDIPGFGVPVGAIATIAGVSAAFMALVVAMAIRARRRPVVTGRSGMIGATGPVVEATGSEGWAEIGGELWRVKARHPLALGERVRVTAVEDRTLLVTASTAWPAAPGPAGSPAAFAPAPSSHPASPSAGGVASSPEAAPTAPPGPATAHPPGDR